MEKGKVEELSERGNDRKLPIRKDALPPASFFAFVAFGPRCRRAFARLYLSELVLFFSFHILHNPAAGMEKTAHG